MTTTPGDEPPTWPALVASTDPATAESSIANAVGAFPEATRTEMLRRVRELANVAHRHCLPGHLTGSALVVEEGTGRFALMLHAKLGRWFQPGGHADGDTNLGRVALREATEETGIAGLRLVTPAIDLDIHEVADKTFGPHLHLDVRYLVIAPQGAVFAPNEESLELRWVEHNDLDNYAPDQGLRRLIRAGEERFEGC